MLSDQEKRQLKQVIESNKHEIFVISIDEMDAIIRSSPNGQKQSVQIKWQKIRDKIGIGTSYYASADDAVTMAKLVGDLGSFGAKAYIKSYGGKPHIILKGHPGLRRILTGTKYGIKNPKVVSMGLGRAGAVAAAKQGGILTVFLLSAYRVVDFVLTDEATLSRLIGTLATDIVKVGLATGASIAVATFVAGLTTIAVGPIIAVVFVGVVSTYALDSLDQRYHLTERVISALDEMGDDASSFIERKQRELANAAVEMADSIIDHAIESARSIAIEWAITQLDRYLSPHPRVR